MADDEKKTSEDVTEEDKPNEPEREPEPDENEPDEDECDEAIGQLLADIAQLESRVGELESKLEQHGIEFEHTRRAEDGAADGVEPTPEERHFYFRKLKRA